MFRTDTPEPRNEDPDDRHRDRTVFTPGRPGPDLAWQPVCWRHTAPAPGTGADRDGDAYGETEKDGEGDGRVAGAPACGALKPQVKAPPVRFAARGRAAASRRVLVPVHATPRGTDVVRFFKDPVGHRVAVAFSSLALLRNVCGADQRWTEMAEECLRETIAGLGLGTVVRDPRLSAAPVRDDAATGRRPPTHR